MPIKKFKPVTPSNRFRAIMDNSDILTKKAPEKSLTESLHKSGGRNHHGRITSRRRGGGHKRKYRIIDFKRTRERTRANSATSSTGCARASCAVSTKVT